VDRAIDALVPKVGLSLKCPYTEIPVPPKSGAVLTQAHQPISFFLLRLVLYMQLESPVV